MNTVTLNDIIHGDRWTGDSNLLRHKPRVRVRDFPSPFDFQEREPVTLVELRMRFFSGKVHHEPRWWEKIIDSTIPAKWRAEMVEHDRLQVELCWGGEKRFDIGLPGEKRWPRDPMTEVQLESRLRPRPASIRGGLRRAQGGHIRDCASRSSRVHSRLQCPWCTSPKSSFP